MAHEVVEEFRVHEGPIKALDVHGAHVVTGGADAVVRLVGLDGNVAASFAGHDDLINSARVRGDGRVATASRDGTVRIWDPSTGGATEAGRHDHWAGAVAWNDTGSLLASISEDKTLRIWDPDGGEVGRVEFPRPSADVDWRGDVIAVAGGDRALHLVDASSGDVMRSVKGARQMLWGVRFAPAGNRFAFASRDRRIRIGTPGEEAVALDTVHGAQVWSVNWSDDAARLVSASADRSAVIWSADDGRPLERIETPDWVRAGRWVDDRLVLVGEDGVIRVLKDDGTQPAAVQTTSVVEPPRACPHLDPLVTGTDAERCQECGSRWELRLCLTCGHVGCCESQLAHGTRHWEATGHPNTTPAPVRELGWRWCYECDAYVKRTAR